MNTAIDLFSGAGGLSTGLTQAGFSVVGAVEKDPTSAETYRLNHPNTRLLVTDIRDLTGPQILREVGLERGRLDLLTGCPPCQGFSTLRTRRRTRPVMAPRDELIFEILRLTRSMRPRALVVENVPGLASDPRFQAFRDGLHACGYESDFAILDATHFAVPQRRQRLVLLAMRRPATLPSEWASPGRIEHRTVRDAIGGLAEAGRSGDPLHDLPDRRSRAVMARIRATPKDGGSRSDVPRHLGCPCHSASDGYHDVYGRMAWDQVSPTITSGCHNPSKGRFLHPEAHRAITLREAAILQSFPRGYRFSMKRGKEHVAWQIGNAFPPALIQPIARRLRREWFT